MKINVRDHLLFHRKAKKLSLFPILILCAVIILPLTGVSAVTGSEIAADGTYSSNAAKVKRFNYNPLITITVKDGKIAAFNVNADMTNKRNQRYMKRAGDHFEKALLGKPASQDSVAAVDSVSHATLSSNAARDSGKAALAAAPKAQGGGSDPNPPAQNDNFVITSGNHLQSIYMNNKAAMESASSWEFKIETIFIGSSNAGDPNFSIPKALQRMSGDASRPGGTEITPYRYKSGNHGLIFRSGTKTTVENFTFGKDNTFGSVDLHVKNGAKVHFKNCILKNQLSVEDGAEVVLENCTVMGSIDYKTANIVFKNVTLTDPSGGIGLNIPSNILRQATAGRYYNHNFSLPVTLNKGSQTAALDTFRVETSIEGLNIGKNKTENNHATITVTGTPSKAEYNARILVTFKYNNAQDTGFGFAIPYYLSVRQAPIRTITYDLNGGKLEGNMGIIRLRAAEGSIIRLPKAPVRDGYTFDYWKGSRYNPGDSYRVTGDHTFTAQWKEKHTTRNQENDQTKTKPDNSQKTAKKIHAPGTDDTTLTMFWSALLSAAIATALSVIRRKIKNAIK